MPAGRIPGPARLQLIRRDGFSVEMVAAFAAHHSAHLDPGSTDRVIDQVMLAR